MATAATISVRMDGDTASLVKELDKASRRSKGAFDSIGKEAAAMARGVAIAAAAAGAALAALAKESFSQIDALAKASDKTGIATDRLAGMKLAASQAGVEFATLTNAMTKATRTVVDAADKGGETAIVFQKLGLNVQDLQRMAPEERFRLLADTIGGIEDPTQRAAAAVQIFGRSGAELLPLFKGGSAGLDEFQAKAEALGLAVKEVDARKIEAANDALERAGLAVQGVGNQFAIAFAPAVEGAANAFTDAVAGSDALKNATRVLGTTFTGFLDTLRTATVLWDGLKAAGAIALTALVNGVNLIRRALLGVQALVIQIQVAWERLRPGDAPRERIQELERELAKVTGKIREIPWVVTPGDLVSQAEAAGEEAGEAAADALADGFGNGPPLTVRPPRLDMTDLLTSLTEAGDQQASLAQRTLDAVRAAAIAGEKALTADLVTITEERARILTDLQRQAAEQQAAATGQANTFDAEKALAANRVKLAEEAAATILAARQTVINAAWAVRLTTTDDASPRLEAVQDELRALQGQRAELTATADTAQAQAALQALEERIAATRTELAALSTGARVEVDIGGVVAGLEAVQARRTELQRQANEEIRRLAIDGQAEVSEALTTSIRAMAENLTEIQRRQAELRAVSTGKPVDFDDDAARAMNQVAVANQVADGLIEARERVRAGGPLALPTTDPTLIAQQTRAQAEAALAVFQATQEQRLEAQRALNETLFMSEQAAGQRLVELAIAQAREKVLAEFQARGEALDETGQVADPQARAAFELQVQEEVLNREKEFLNQRLALQQQFGGRYMALQKLIATFTGKTWADNNAKTLSNTAAFASAALSIGGALFRENKGLAIAQAIMGTFVGATNALRDVPYPANIAAAASVIATGLAQVAQIRSTNPGSGAGGGAIGGISGAGASLGALPPALGVDETAEKDRRVIQVIIEGDFIGTREFVEGQMVPILRDIADGQDVLLFSGSSRQAREIREGG